MDVIEAIRTRRSIRGFRPDPVPKEVLGNILDIARRAPSGMNTQPWEITVASGEALDNIKRDNIQMLASGAIPNRDIPSQRFEGVFRQRQVDLAIQLFQLMGIAREDKEKRAEWMQRGFRFFDAPAAIIISVDSSLHESRVRFDIGTISQTICLAALNYGLGTCIEDQGITYPEVVRKHTGIPESKQIIISIAIGYPDWDFPANKVESEREPVESITIWCGFD
jgi:nitroreductase